MQIVDLVFHLQQHLTVIVFEAPVVNVNSLIYWLLLGLLIRTQ